MITEAQLEVESLGRTHCFELLERICSSTELKRATRLRDFLRYVGNRSLEPNGAPISEHEIGLNVFERRQNYDTSADNIVRVNASELRKRIAAYYATEGVNESILLDIPLRTYTPQFRRRAVAAVPCAEPPASVSVPHIIETRPLPTPSIQPVIKWWPRYAFPALSLVLAVTCLFLVFRGRVTQNDLYAWKSEPTLGPFWRGLIESPRQTDVVVADTSFSLVEDILKKRISLNDYLNHDYMRQIQASDLSPDLKKDLQTIASRNNASLGDFRVAQKILAFDPISKRAHLQYSRDYRPGAIKTNNVILIGSSRSNPWSELFQDRLNFILDYDPSMSEMLVRNRRPQSGESSVYESPVDPGSSNGFSVIDYIPNREHTANVLIIAGTTSEATEAAGEFLTSEEPFHRFQDRLQTHSLPYFEVLLKTTKLVGTPLSAEVIAYRTFPDRPIDAH